MGEPTAPWLGAWSECSKALSPCASNCPTTSTPIATGWPASKKPVDWEFAGSGDPLFDLATLASHLGWSDDQRSPYLAACGWTDSGDLALLRTMRYVVAFFEFAWSLVQHGLRGSASGFDYLAHSRVMYGAMVESAHEFRGLAVPPA